MCIITGNITGAKAYRQLTDTSKLNQTVFTAPVGTYILTITGTAGNVAKQKSIIIT